MRIAFVDLYFSWPPHGGADVDLYHVMAELQRLDFDVRLFVSSSESSWERGKLQPDEMPFPVTRIDFAPSQINRRELPDRFRREVDAWKPDVVFLADGFFLKPYVSEVLSDYPAISRYYAYELTCPRDSRLFKNGAVCPMNYLRTPQTCRVCSLEYIASDIKRWRFLCWSEEYLAARAFMPSYYRLVVDSLRRYRSVIVSNRLHREQLENLNNNVRIIPGGTDVERFEFNVPREKRAGERKIILMSGRAEDPAKGLAILRKAGERLYRKRSDFEIWATHTDFSLNNEWFKAVGWHDFAGMTRLYRDADICVFPSVWYEPFGLVAVEAMASGRPVCASRLGGLQDIVLHGETGFLFDPGDDKVLADTLEQLLGAPELRLRMGEAGRARVEEEYDWKKLVPKHYPQVLEAALK